MRHVSCCGLILAAIALLIPAAAAADAPLAAAVGGLESRLAGDPAAAGAGPLETARYAAAVVSAALAVFEQSRHLDKPHFARNDGIDGRAGLYNPDNLYSSTLVSDKGIYRIHGRRGSHVMLSLQLLDAYPIVGLGRNLAAINLETLGIRAGDDFEIFLGGPSHGRHWFALPAGTKAVLARQTFEDWSAETPSSLRIDRLDRGAGKVAPDEAARTAADYLLAADRTWNAGYLPRIRQLPVNRIPPPRASDTDAGGLGGQQSVAARYRLTAGQALIITVGRSNAIYQGIQLGNPWFVAPNYIDHQVSLNRSQAAVDADGRIRYVISLSDPGVANWLDPAGFGEGYLFMRWQGLSRPLVAEEAPTVELVTLAELPGRLPAETRQLSAAQRAEQLAQRLSVPIRK